MTIVRLKRARDGLVRVEFPDGSALRVSDGTVLELGLRAGLELDDGALEALCAAAEADGLKRSALRMAAGRLLSRREAEKKLTEKGADPERAAELADWLQSLGAVNDALLAENLAAHYAAKGYGRAGIRRELQRRGLGREDIDRALEQSEPDREAIDKLVAARLKGKTPDRRELDRTAQALLRRGHSWDEIREALGRYERELEEEL